MPGNILMSKVLLDCKGLSCPQPVLQAKDALERGADDVEVVVDNEASKNNVARFARNQGLEVEELALGDDCFKVLIRGRFSQSEQTLNEDDFTCELPSGKGLVYVISADSMGRGSDELGWGLLQTYIQTIKDVKPLPAKILFYNAGVRLVTEESGALEALKQLQKQGVEIMACGTCLDFFELKSAIKIGQISNMYDIMSSMTEASQVVSPL